VDDRVRLGLEHRPAHGRTIEQIERDRLGAERPQAFRFFGRPRGADHLVASPNQLGNEPGADRTARSCNEDSHRVLLLVCHIAPISGSTAMTHPDDRM